MSNLAAHPDESSLLGDVCLQPELHLVPAREVPLGGIRAITVRRTLPDRTLPVVGPWCFLDAFDSEVDAMTVLPHPHTGLQTVTWPLDGEIRHRDSLGSDLVLRPGQLNLMTSGRGIAHSEFSLPATGRLRGLQLWVALPPEAADGAASFDHYDALPAVTGPGFEGMVIMGEFAGVASPARTFSPLVGAELRLTAADTALPLRPDWEYALMVIDGDATSAPAVIEGEATLAPGALLFLGRGREAVSVAGAVGARLLLLGGAPLADDLVMWWNFVGRSHEEILAARDAWESGSDRFGSVDGHDGLRIPAPPMPNVRLTPRRRRGPLAAHPTGGSNPSAG